jgi:hypothetical protein
VTLPASLCGAETLGSDTGAIPPGPVLGTSPIAYLKAKDPMSRYTHSASWPGCRDAHREVTGFRCQIDP